MDISAARPSRAGDEAGLTEIWKAAFGDDDKFIDLFMKQVYTPGMASVAECDGKIVSAIYLLTGTALVMPQGRAVASPYCYTLGTLEEYRGRGLGAAVSEHIMRTAMLSAPMVSLVPAQESLYGWYADTFGLLPISRTREALIPTAELDEVSPVMARAHRVDAESYARVRELTLAGKCHVRFSVQLLKWYDRYIRSDGGGLYLLDVDGHAGCAACEPDGQRLSVKELLLPRGSFRDALSALSALFKCSEVHVRTPLFFPGEGKARDFAVARMADGLVLPEKDSVWWGLAFD